MAKATFSAPPAATPAMNTIASWSFSKRSDFDTCKRMAFLKHVKRIPEPERPLPPGKTEHANDRGTRIHQELEDYVRAKPGAAYPHEAKAFRTEVDKLRADFDAGRVSLEGEWGMSKEWEPAAWNKAWLRLKLDGIDFLSPVEAVAIDYKSGRKFGNEIKHGEQLNLYAVVSFLRYPALELVHTELWYIDQDELTRQTLTRDQALRFKRKWDMAGNAITSNTVWPPNPNIFSCRFCPYKNTEHCDVGVSK